MTNHPHRSRKGPYDPTYHRDGTVTYWDVYAQSWHRAHADQISDQTMASQDRTFRAWVRRHSRDPR